MQSASVITYGCTHNQKDSQLIEAQLLKNGILLTDEDDAELIVVNTCTVKEPTEAKIIAKLDTLNDKKLIITGCLGQTLPDKLKNRYPNAVVLGVNAVYYISGALRAINKSDEEIKQFPVSNHLTESGSMIYLTEKPLLASTSRSNLNIVQINEGCLNSCSFCATKLARGRLRSFSRDSVITSIRRNQTAEVWLTSQDTGCYGFDISDNLTNLIADITKIKRKFWTRIGMGNPNNFIKILEEVVDAFHSDKIYKFLHLPVQSGSNKVLKHMKRGYTVEEYELIVDSFRKEFANLTLSTDIIVGYPTEDEGDFLKTIQTVRKTRPSIINISKYWRRANTPAATLPALPETTRKSRSLRLKRLTEKIQLEDNRKWIGWQGEVLIVKQAPKGGMEARNIFYKPIIIENGKIGTWKTVRITSAKRTYFVGELLN